MTYLLLILGLLLGIYAGCATKHPDVNALDPTAIYELYCEDGKLILASLDDPTPLWTGRFKGGQCPEWNTTKEAP